VFADGHLLLASCFGDEDTGGGLYCFDGYTVEEIDRLSSTGLAVGGGRLLRMLRSDQPSELLVYDANGVKRYYRLDSVIEAHDVLWSQGCVVVVSTSTNSIVWLDGSGEVAREWKAPGQGDCWHLNSLVEKDGELYASAFGRFEQHREWGDRERTSTSGMIFHVETGRDVVTGLACPHHPRYVDGCWVVCDSRSAQLVAIEEGSSRVVKRAQLSSWTRGLVVSGSLILVGESARRGDPDAAEHAWITILSRDSWTVLERVPLPVSEVYDLVIAPAPLVEGARRGFRTNPLRVAEQSQHALFEEVGIAPRRLWATGDPLPPEACRVSIDARVPTTMLTGATTRVPCTIENIGGAILGSAPPHPVQISYRWLDPRTRRPLEGIEGTRTRLPEALPPGMAVTRSVAVIAPPVSGDYLLRLTLVQEFVAWFDDIVESNADTHPVTVVAASSD
jgi:uncharacterized protein DUF4915